MASFVGELNSSFFPEPEGNVFNSIWKEYEGVVFKSLITSFGLDFLVQDQYGGDVDTVHNVRAGVAYKNQQTRPTMITVGHIVLQNIILIHAILQLYEKLKKNSMKMESC